MKKLFYLVICLFVLMPHVHALSIVGSTSGSGPVQPPDPAPPAYCMCDSVCLPPCWRKVGCNYTELFLGSYGSFKSTYYGNYNPTQTFSDVPWTSQTSFNTANNTTSIIFSGNPISTQAHFGDEGSAAGTTLSLQALKSLSWVTGSTETPMPGFVSILGDHHDNATHVSTFYFRNFTDSAIKINDFGYRIFQNPQPLAQLNVPYMPVASFTSAGFSSNLVVNPNDTLVFQVPNLNTTTNPNLYVAFYQTTSFVNSGVGNVTKTWTGIKAIQTNNPPSSIPTLTEWALILLTTLLAAAGIYVVNRRITFI